MQDGYFSENQSNTNGKIYTAEKLTSKNRWKLTDEKIN